MNEWWSKLSLDGQNTSDFLFFFLVLRNGLSYFPAQVGDIRSREINLCRNGVPACGEMEGRRRPLPHQNRGIFAPFAGLSLSLTHTPCLFLHLRCLFLLLSSFRFMTSTSILQSNWRTLRLSNDVSETVPFRLGEVNKRLRSPSRGAAFRSSFVLFGLF